MQFLPRRFLTLLLVIALPALAGSAAAQRLFVVTEARDVAGEPVRLTALSADFNAGILPGGFALPGTALIGPVIASGSGGGVLLASGPPWRGDRLEPRHLAGATAAFRVAPFNPWPQFDGGRDSGWRRWPVATLRDPSTLSGLLLSAAVRVDGDGTWRGRLRSQPWPPEGTPGRVQASGGEVALALGPRYVFSLASGHCLAVGFAGDEGEALLQRADPTAPFPDPPVPLADGTYPAGPRHLAAAALGPEETVLWLLFSHVELDSGGAAPRSWLVAVDTTRLTALGAPLILPGVAAPGFSALSASLGDQCWVATRTPGTDFARITRAVLGASGPADAQSAAIVGLERSLSVVAHPTSGEVAVAIDRDLEFWPGGVRKGMRQRYDAPIARLRWTEGGLLAGEGNRLHHAMTPECAPRETLTFQTGWVADFVEIHPEALPLPDADGDGIQDDDERRQQTRPDDPDTDGDGVPDGSDPFPSAPSPQLRVRAEVVFPHSAVGRQLRALQVESLGDPDAQWRIDFDAAAMPWLRVHPRNFRGTGQAYMGIDPERYDPGGVTEGAIQIHLAGRPRGNRPGYTAAYSPATVRIRVEPPRDPLQTILWLWPARENAPSFRDDRDPEGLRGLGDLAGGYPGYFSCVEHRGPFNESLDAYSLVVLTARAAAEGALTQSALLDYLAEGGAVLFLGEHLAGEQFRDLRPWLAPLGIEVDAATPLQGAIRPGGTDELLEHWTDFSLRDGCRVTARDADGARVFAGEGLAFLARPHGYGRLAILAARTPLESKALEKEANRAFAQDLLYWLSRAGYAVEDRDGDGLLDATEDANNNGAVDPGETDWLAPDTDRDGIPDGLEDTNRNGVVDPGETDPRNADSDGDGISDGADGTPVAGAN